MHRFLLVLGLLCAGSAWAQPLVPPRWERSSAVVETADGRRLAFSVEVADDDEERAYGLMFRRKLAADAGMLFVLPQDQPLSMWMRNTFIPLDMLFLSADGRIVAIVERTVPQSLSVIASPGKVRGVLEVNGGTAARLHLKPGDRVVHPAFGG